MISFRIRKLVPSEIEALVELFWDRPEVLPPTDIANLLLAYRNICGEEDLQLLVERMDSSAPKRAA